MKCAVCGFETDENVKFCTSCGARMPLPQNQPVYNTPPQYNQTPQSNQNPQYNQAPQYNQSPAFNSGFDDAPQSFNNKLLSLFRAPLFLAVCILISVSTASGLFFSGGLNILNVLFTVFLWIIYSKAHTGNVDDKNLRNISGTVFAQYVINWVLVGIFGVCGVLSFAASNLIKTIIQSKEISSVLRDRISNIDSFYEFGSIVFAFILGGVLIIIAAIIALYNIFCIKSVHKFTKSLYISAGANKEMLYSPSTAKTWILIIGILDGISALIGGASSFVSNGSMTAALIIIFILINKYFKPQNMFN